MQTALPPYASAPAALKLDAAPGLTICVPTYRDNPSGLVKALSGCHGSADTTLIVYDDGSGNRALSRQIETALSRYPGNARLITEARNRGRSAARNALARAAQGDWLLLLDADMRPVRADFLSRYLEAISALAEPGLVVGGFALAPGRSTPAHRLHAAQSRRSECLPAARRTKAPGRYVFTSNVAVHREVLDRVGFDPGFTGWGWEDVDWGLRVAKAFAIRHIDNPALHLGLDEDEALIRKYAGSGGNFARLARRHPEAAGGMPIYRAACLLQRVAPLRAPAERTGLLAARQRWLPMPARLFGLKLLRAAAYAREGLR